jgi:site-specific recombinase XerD
VRSAVLASKAANTLRAYQSDLRQVAAYLAETGHTHLVQPEPDSSRWQSVCTNACTAGCCVSSRASRAGCRGVEPAPTFGEPVQVAPVGCAG